jgi:hypothetical protein
LSVSCVDYDLWDKLKGNKSVQMISNLGDLIRAYQLYFEKSIKGTEDNHLLYFNILQILEHDQNGVIAHLPQIKEAFKYNSNQTQATINRQNMINLIVSKFHTDTKNIY